MLNQDLLNRAAAKNVDAMVEVAFAYYNGTDVEMDEEKAFVMFQEILSLDPMQRSVCSNLGNCWFYGYGTPVDKEKGIAYWKHASEMGYAGADTWLGIAYRDGDGVEQDVERGIAYLKNSAQDGNVRAMLEMANTFYFGECVPRDIDIAKQYYSQAAENGSGYGYYMLGLIAKAEGDDVKAFLYYKKGAELQHAYSIYSLARCYDEGIGTSVDKKAAFDCYKFAADNGIADAAALLADKYARGEDGVVEPDENKAFLYMSQAFDGGDKAAAHFLAQYYIQGYGTPTDLEKAAEIAIKGAEMNADIPAVKSICLNDIIDISRMYYQGDMVDKNIALALRHLEKGANLGSASCMYSAGILYEEKGPFQNNAKALQYFRMAAEAGHAAAYGKIGFFYYEGKEVDKNPSQAFQYFKKAREMGETIAEGPIIFMLSTSDLDDLNVDINEEISHAKPLAEEGDANAALAVYKLMLKDSVSNIDDCVPWLKLSVQGGNLMAINGYAGLWVADLIQKIDADAFIEGCQKAQHNGVDLSPEVYYALGQSYKEAIGINHNLALAEKYIKMAADSGYVLAMRVLGSEYDTNGAFRNDRDASMFYYKKAIDADDDQFSLFFIGVHYLKMNDSKSAAEYLRRALDGSNENIANKAKELLTEIQRVDRENAYRAEIRESMERKAAAASTSANTTSGSQKSGGCYIATAVYGSYDCPEVWALRRYRDCYLSKSLTGRLFIKVYYAVSPKLVRAFGSYAVFNKFWRKHLDRMVCNLKARGFDDTPYHDK